MKMKVKLNEKVKKNLWDDQNEDMEKWVSENDDGKKVGRWVGGGGSDVWMEDVSVSFSGDDEQPLK